MQPIKFISPTLEISSKVAIVGSSGKLIDTNYGHLIDSYDDVVRFNRAPTDSYEKFVGNRTTLHVANNHVFNNNYEDSEIWTGQRWASRWLIQKPTWFSDSSAHDDSEPAYL